MKLKNLKLCSIILLLLFIGASCQKDEIEYADESIEISSLPEISVYKTNDDYFNNIAVQITSEGKLNAIPAYILGDPRINVDKDGNMRVNFRWRLKSGFIVDKEASLNKVFTNISIQEYIDWNTDQGLAGWPDSLMEPRIIDKNPFIEYYYLSGINKTPKVFTVGELNDMIESGTLETVFTKLK